MIKLLVIGNLGKDAIVNNVNGKNVINFSVAHTEKYKDAQGNPKDRTVWVECAYWTDKTAIAPYLKKGTQVYAEGNPDVRSYTTQDGKTGASLSLRILTIQLLGSKNAENSSNEGGSNQQYQPNQQYQSAPQPNNYNQPPVNQYAQQPAQQMPAAQDITEPLDDLPF
ncbi:MAG: single-stranded DNA-binding protein [Chitinophagaceae bacterium]